MLRMRSEREKEIEILVLRHQLLVLERQVARPQLRSADRALFAAFSRALPRRAWMVLGILELVCTVGLIVPAALHWQPRLTVVAATVLAIESLVFVGVHVKYREITPTILSGVLGLLMAFIAYGRMVLKPIF